MISEKFGSSFDQLFVTVLTPFKENYEVDENEMRKFLRYFMRPDFINAGGGIIINAACGEIFYLNRKEVRRNVEMAMEECGGKVPVFAGARGLATSEVVQTARDAKEAGADGLFLFSPEGDSAVSSSWDAEKFPEIWVDLAKEVSAAVDLPIIAHPKRTPLKATMAMCQEISNIIGWKMIYGYQDSLIIARGLRSLDRHVAILGAQADLFQENLATGYFDGTASGAWNYAMEPMLKHIRAWKCRDIDEAYKLWKSGLEELQSYVFMNMGRLHPKYKAAAWLRGLISLPFMRPPVGKPRKEEILNLRKLLIGAGIECIPEKEMDRVLQQLER